MSDTQQTLSPETEQKIQSAIQDVMNGKPLYKVAGWTEDQVNTVYTAAYNHYKTGSYEEALKLFRPLIVMNSTDTRVWLGFAASAQMTKNYKDALEGYAYASILNTEDPTPFFHAMECHIALKNFYEAKTAGEYVVGVCEKKPGYEKILDRTKVLLKAIEARLA